MTLDEGDCRGAGKFGEWNCYYAGYRYSLLCRWNASNASISLAGVHHGAYLGHGFPSGSTSATVTGGALSLQPAPNAVSTPMGTYDTAVYHPMTGAVAGSFGGPVSQFPALVSAIRSTGAATFSGDAEVSKNYVDTVIAA